ncbi:MAG TPA: 50S ribosomal protein L23 [Candidatus Paceibacterota bacterium]|nr:50S ribosomal protein L23 [Candidatus Paceibacterota bacterium]
MNYAHILKHARITEKAGMASALSVYVFDVDSAATKRDISRAVQAIYKVTPVKIAVLPVPAKKVRHMRTGREGFKTGGKKAYVFLKKGETIAIS